MDNDFLQDLMSVIIDEGMVTPKSQIERAIAPFFDIFIENILDNVYSQKRCFRLIASEFSLNSKMDNNQSVNIDYLLYNVCEKKLYFLESRTDETSFEPSQFVSYKDIIDKKQNLYEFLKKLCDMSKDKTKYKNYKNLIEYKIEKNNLNKSIFKKNIDIIYLVPKTTFLNRKWGDDNQKMVNEILKNHKIIYFSDLPQNLDIYNNEWQTIREFLIKLDGN